MLAPIPKPLQNFLQFNFSEKERISLLQIKDDSDYLAFKETTLSLRESQIRSVFLSVPVPPLSAHSNLLYDDNKYANGTMIFTSLPKRIKTEIFR